MSRRLTRDGRRLEAHPKPGPTPGEPDDANADGFTINDIVIVLSNCP